MDEIYCFEEIDGEIIDNKIRENNNRKEIYLNKLKKTMANGKNKYGQYMTPEIVARFMVSLADLSDDSKILEPCSGEGIFLDILKEKRYNNIIAYEIDESLIKNLDLVRNKSFISENILQKFDLIIGNPPYIRWKNLEDELKDELIINKLWNEYCNALCDYSSIFIVKAIELLNENGQLIFITPEYWLNTTHSIMLRNYMVENGYFEEIYHFNETPMFEKTTVSLIIFKYIKSNNPIKKEIKLSKYFAKKKLNEDILNNLKSGIKQDNTEYIEIPQFKKDKSWILAPLSVINELNDFKEKCRIKNSEDLYLIKDFCDIGNGLVSGLDKAFQINSLALNEKEKNHLLKVVKAKNLVPYYHKEITDYIFINEIKTEDELREYFPNFYNHLQEYKSKLNARYKYNREINYWEWVFLRNFKLFSKDVERIFVPCKERISNKNYFRFALANKGIFPTQDVTAIFKKEKTQESIYYLLAFLNSKYVFDWLRYNGIVKGSIVEFSEKPIANIPFRKIDFKNQNDVRLHDQISELTKKYIEIKDLLILEQIKTEMDKLFQN